VTERTNTQFFKKISDTSNKFKSYIWLQELHYLRNTNSRR